MEIIFKPSISKAKFLVTSLVYLIALSYFLFFDNLSVYIFSFVILILIVNGFYILFFNKIYILSKENFTIQNLLGKKNKYKVTEIEEVRIVEQEENDNIVKILYVKIINIDKEIKIQIEEKEILLLFCNFKKLGIKTQIIELDQDINEFENEGEFENEYDCEKILKK